MIDTHTHITCDNYLDYQNDINEAKLQGLKALILVATNIEERKQVLHFRSDFVKVAYGIYPSAALEIDEALFEDLDRVMSDDTFIALGEIGLDYYWYPDNKEVQKEIFKRQIDIANKHNKPIIIHTRDAMADTYEILKNHPNKRKGIIHCFSGSLEMAKKFIDLGYYLSFGGVLTFKNSKSVKQALLGIDLNYVLFETDAPYLTPEPYRGQPNKTYYVRHVYNYAAQLLGLDVSELEQIVANNYQRLFCENN